MVAKLKRKALEELIFEKLMTAIHHELERAGQRITTAKDKEYRNVDRLRWFIRLSALNPHELSIGDWSNLKYELLHISYGSRPKFPDQRSANDFLDRYFASGSLFEISNISKGDVQNLCQETQGYLLAYRNKEMLVAKLPGFQVVLYPTSPHGSHWVRAFDSDDFSGPLNFVLFETLSNAGHLLGTCPECGRLFIADRMNQRYCSLRCQTRVASRKYLATPKDRIGKRGRPSQGGATSATSGTGSQGGATSATSGRPSKTISPKTVSR